MSKKQQTEQQVQDQQAPDGQATDGMEEAVPRMSRHELALKVVAGIRSETTLGELAEEADRLYREGRGGEPEPDVERQTWIVHEVLQTAKALGVVTLDETWIIKVRPKAAGK
jgi:hypothetical protein